MLRFSLLALASQALVVDASPTRTEQLFLQRAEEQSPSCLTPFSYLVFGDGYVAAFDAADEVKFKWTDSSNRGFHSATVLPDASIALLSEFTAEALKWSPCATTISGRSEGEMVFTASVNLGQETGMASPVWAHLTSDNHLHIALFGQWSNERNFPAKTGVAVIDVSSNPRDGPVFKLIQKTTCEELQCSHIHSIWEFNGKILVADLGNPWTNPPIAGMGVLEVVGKDSFKEFHVAKTLEFVQLTTSPNLKKPLNARTIAQDPVDSKTLYVVTQSAFGSNPEPTRLVKLSDFKEVASVDLPSRGGDAGEGGADVIAFEHNRVFVSDRVSNATPTAQPGRGFFVDFSSEGKIENREAPIPLGSNPRFTKMIGYGNGEMTLLTADNKAPRGQAATLTKNVVDVNGAIALKESKGLEKDLGGASYIVQLSS